MTCSFSFDWGLMGCAQGEGEEGADVGRKSKRGHEICHAADYSVPCWCM